MNALFYPWFELSVRLLSSDEQSHEPNFVTYRWPFYQEWVAGVLVVAIWEGLTQWG